MPTKITPHVYAPYAHGATTLVEAARMTHENDYTGQRGMETFDHFANIELVVLAAIENSCRAAFGPRYRTVDDYGKSPLTVAVLPHEKGVILKSRWEASYGGLFDFLNKGDNFSLVFGDIQAKMIKIIKNAYPDVNRVWLQHNYAYKRKLQLISSVLLEPRMPMPAVVAPLAAVA
jgi:hypothetical protein